MKVRLRKSQNYEEWKACAQELDAYMDKEDWKQEIYSPHYDVSVVLKFNNRIQLLLKSTLQNEQKFLTDNTKNNIKQLEEKDLSAHHDLMQAMITAGCRPNFGGVENVRLYSQTYYGTKDVVEKFVKLGE